MSGRAKLFGGLRSPPSADRARELQPLSFAWTTQFLCTSRACQTFILHLAAAVFTWRPQSLLGAILHLACNNIRGSSADPPNFRRIRIRLIRGSKC